MVTSSIEWENRRNSVPITFKECVMGHSQNTILIMKGTIESMRKVNNSQLWWKPITLANDYIADGQKMPAITSRRQEYPTEITF